MLKKMVKELIGIKFLFFLHYTNSNKSVAKAKKKNTKDMNSEVIKVS